MQHGCESISNQLAIRPEQVQLLNTANRNQLGMLSDNVAWFLERRRPPWSAFNEVALAAFRNLCRDNFLIRQAGMAVKYLHCNA